MAGLRFDLAGVGKSECGNFARNGAERVFLEVCYGKTRCVALARFTKFVPRCGGLHDAGEGGFRGDGSDDDDDRDQVVTATSDDRYLRWHAVGSGEAGWQL